MRIQIKSINLKQFVLIIIFSTALFLSGFFISQVKASSPTYLTSSYSIETPTTWTKANSPYVVAKDVVIQINSILTIEPGVVVKFDTLRSQGLFSGLEVNGPSGWIKAQGTSQDPIIFTSIHDNDYDSLVGTSEDPQPGDWRGILFENDESILEHIIMRYASGSVNYAGALGFGQNSKAQISDSIIEQSYWNAIKVTSNAEPVLERLTIQNNKLLAVYAAEDAGHGILRDSLLRGNESDQSLMALSSNSLFELKNNTYEDNVVNSALLLGSVDRAVTWYNIGLPYVVRQNVIINNTSELTIKPGVIMKFSGGNASYVRLLIKGQLKALGTLEAPIIFTSFRDNIAGNTNTQGLAGDPLPGDWGELDFEGSSDSVLDYVELRYAGNFKSDFSFGFPGISHANSIFIDNSEVDISNSVIDNGFYYGIRQQNSGSFNLQDSQVINHKIGIWVTDVVNPLPTINQSQIFDNIQYGLVYLGADPLDATNNWWGDVSGPNHVDNPSGLGDKIFGNVLFDPWLQKPPSTLDPVVIVPGILGSWKVGNNWQVDPILHTYDNLWLALQDAGYVVDETLFALPYQWRQDNRTTANELKDKIVEVKGICKCSEVDLVVHSMGGLVARSYIQSIDYDNDVGQVIFLGVPHRGSVESYLKWEGAGFLNNLTESLLKRFFTLEAFFNGYLNLHKYINEKIISIQQLLPIEGYLKEDNTIRIYPNNYPQNSFLENLNVIPGVDDLKNKVNITNIIGDLGENSTLKIIRVVSDPVLSDNKWIHGYPENFDDPSTDQGLENGRGDGTVPRTSQDALGSDVNRYIISSEHRLLPTNTQQDIIEVLTGIRPSNFVNATVIEKLLLIDIKSPADFYVIAPDSKKLGKDFATGNILNEIPLGFYSGYDADIEFLTIPNPLNGEYQIILEGTDNGDYEIEVSLIDDESIITNSFTGFITEELEEELNFNFNASNPEDIEIEPEDTNPPIITINNPKSGQTYTRQDIITIDYEVIDDTGVQADSAIFASESKEVNNGEEIDLFFETIGTHTLTVEATDYLGNTAIESIEFFVGATFRSLIQDIKQAYKQGSIKLPVIKKILVKQVKLIKKKKRIWLQKLLLRYKLLNELKAFHNADLINNKAYKLLKGDVRYLIKHL